MICSDGVGLFVDLGLQLPMHAKRSSREGCFAYLQQFRISPPPVLRCDPMRPTRQESDSLADSSACMRLLSQVKYHTSRAKVCC